MALHFVGAVFGFVSARRRSDGPEIFDGTEFHIFSWSSALSYQGDVLSSKMLICCIEEDLLTTKAIDELIHFLKWNIDVMESGVHPTFDHNGQSLTLFELGNSLGI